jgi:hypothetical protein
LDLVLSLLSKYTLSIINTLVFLNLFIILLIVSLLNTFLRLISVIIIVGKDKNLRKQKLDFK